VAGGEWSCTRTTDLRWRVRTVKPAVARGSELQRGVGTGRPQSAHAGSLACMGSGDCRAPDRGHGGRLAGWRLAVEASRRVGGGTGLVGLWLDLDGLLPCLARLGIWGRLDGQEMPRWAGRDETWAGYGL
jgi:hypothetical protein